MNAREIFLETMNFNTDIRTIKWEFGYMGKTVKNWYEQGLPFKHYPKIPPNFLTTKASVYTTTWVYEWKKEGASKIDRIELTDGIAIQGGGLNWPNQGFPLDSDVAEYFNYDKSQFSVDVEELFCPSFEPVILEEDSCSISYIDYDGISRKYLKKEGTMAAAYEWPVKDWESWNDIKEERLRIEDISKRFPKNWDYLVEVYANRDYPLVLGGYPLGLFGTPAHLLGYDKLFMYYFDKPDLVKDIINTFVNIWIAVWEEVLAKVEIDAVHIWEDISMGKGSMVSPSVIKEFMVPQYKRISDFLKGKKVKNILLDTDGDCNELIPIFLDCGITGLYPMETSAGMDVVGARKKYPELQMMGGIPKSEIAKGKNRIDELLKITEELIKTGGYIPFGDHLIPPHVSWDNFKYYREKLNKIIESNGKS